MKKINNNECVYFNEISKQFLKNYVI
jgi:hypothetical protein